MMSVLSVSIHHDVRVIIIIIVTRRGGDDSYQDEAVREEDGHADHQDDGPQQDHRQHRVGLRPEQQQYQIFFQVTANNLAQREHLIYVTR